MHKKTIPQTYVCGIFHVYVEGESYSTIKEQISIESTLLKRNNCSL